MCCSPHRCNADYQYQKRGVPDVDLSEGQRDVPPAAEPPSFMVYVLRGVRSVLASAIATTLATAMRAANIADFYMTKYQCKPQEKLGSIMQPFLAGMRRIEMEEAKQTGSQPQTIPELARRRVRRFIFSANRTMWFSACELATFLMTGDTAVETESATKTFSGRGMAMMHECKRLLNDSTVSDGLLFPGKRVTGGGDAVAHLLVVSRAVVVEAAAGLQSERSADDVADCAGSAAEQAAHGVGGVGSQHTSAMSLDSGADIAGDTSEDTSATC